jgi:pimeloyl-ACP methyl ester carboxylesterase
MGTTSTQSLQVKQMQVNGVELAYVDEGKGDTVVFVHGAEGDWRTYEGIRPWISAKYHYVSYSRRYHYPNQWTDDGSKYNVDQHIDDLAGFIRGLNVGRVHLIGNSYAGRMAGLFALRHPELLRSVMLGDASLIPPGSAEGKAAMDAIRQDMAKAVAAAKAGDDDRAAMLVWDAVNQPYTFDKAPQSQQKRWLENARTTGPMLSGATPRAVSCEQVMAIKVPVAVISGELSRDGYRFGNEALLRCLPAGTPYFRIPDAHHKWNEENPDEAAKAILGFIASK